MRNIILVTRLTYPHIEIGATKCFVDINKIVSVGLPVGDVSKLYFENEVWYIPAKEFKEVMHVWAPYYSTLESYKNLIKED